MRTGLEPRQAGYPLGLTASNVCYNPLFYCIADAMATEEWKKEVLKHEDYIKNLEEKYKKKCEDMEVC